MPVLLSVIAKDYICRSCGSHLTLRPDPKTGRARVYCVANSEHFGWIKRSSAEMQERKEWLRLLELLLDPILIQSIPGWPTLELPPVEQCYAELYYD